MNFLLCVCGEVQTCGVEETEVRLLVGSMQRPLRSIRTQGGMALQSEGQVDGQRGSDSWRHFPHLELSSMLLLVPCLGNPCLATGWGTSVAPFTNWALLQVEQLSGSFQNVSKHLEEDPGGD